MVKQCFGRGAGVVFAAAVLAVACGGSKPPAASPADGSAKGSPVAAKEEVHERIAPHTCAARNKLAQLVGESTAPPAPHSVALAETAESAPPPTSVAAGTKLAANETYRVIAPATVLIRDERGMGTGVVIDPKGYVLTNFHVVSDGRKKDFVLSVDVNFGDLTPTGRMNRQEKSYDGVVVKADPVRDLALIKVKDPPKNLTAAKLAKSAPQIAEKVIAVGHAGIGFLWAAKTCSIASIGERQQDSSVLAGLDCTHPDPALGPREAEQQKKSCEEQKKRMADALMSRTQGLAIQTDCAITHGDSGGPLVNTAGEVVGLNQSITVDLATAGFHVHLDELREFTSKYGEDGVAILPDPYCDGGFEPTLEDVDLDGVPDTLVSKGSMGILGGYDRMSLLIDLDQDTFKKKKDPNVPFDAEIGLLVTRENAYVWYDTDGDGRFDLLLVDKDNDGQPESAYRLDAEGHAKEDKEAVPKHDFSAKLVSDASLHARLGKIANAIGGARYSSKKVLAAASQTTTIPDPLLGAGTQGRLLDTDGDGKPDVAFMRGMFSRGVLIDADEDSLGSSKPGDPADDLVKAKKVDAEISVVVQGNAVWAMYDTDNDSKFDLVLVSTDGADISSLTATNAWHLGGGGEMTPAPDQIGRKVLRPGLISFPRAVSALRVLLADMASDEGMGSLPSPTSSRGRFHLRDVKGVPAGTVVEAQFGSSSVMLVDVDHDSKLTAKSDVPKVMSEGKLDAEVAVVHRGGAEGGSDWIYYDTDGDGKFDLVLFVAASGQEPVQAYRMKKGATALEVDATAVAGRPMRTKSVFKDKAMAAKWKALAGKIFKASVVEE